jgi:hypothetical protein
MDILDSDSSSDKVRVDMQFAKLLQVRVHEQDRDALESESEAESEDEKVSSLCVSALCAPSETASENEDRAVHQAVCSDEACMRRT